MDNLISQFEKTKLNKDDAIISIFKRQYYRNKYCKLYNASIKCKKIIKKYIEKKKIKEPNFPYILKQLQQYLTFKNIALNNSNEDKRINSSIDEGIILDMIEKNPLFKPYIKKSPPRHWHDFSFKYNNKWFPCNVKTTNMKQADNAGNLSICLYALTNFSMNIEKKYDNGKIWSDLCSKINKREFNIEKFRDYYFLVIPKIKEEKIIVSSILNLQEICINWSNLPFQISWKKNRERKPILSKDFSEKWINLLNKANNPWFISFYQSIKKIKNKK